MEGVGVEEESWGRRRECGRSERMFPDRRHSQFRRHIDAVILGRHCASKIERSGDTCSLCVPTKALLPI